MLNFLKKKFFKSRVSTICWAFTLSLTAFVIILPAWELLQAKPPIGANQYFSLETMQKGLEFTRESVVLSAVHQLLNLVFLLALVFTTAGAKLIKRLEKAGGGSIVIGLVLISLAVAMFEEILSLPFAWYLGYFRESLWGLSVQSLSSWLYEYFLNFVINWLSNLLTFIIIFWLIRRFQRKWWVFAGSALALLWAIWIMIYPVFVYPLFAEQIPSQNSQLTSSVEKLAHRAGVTIDGIWEEKASLKTNRANACVSGLGPTKRIVVWDTLIRDYTPDEVETVIAHELGHAAYHDNFWMWLGASASSFLGCLIVADVLTKSRSLGKLKPNYPYQPRALPIVILIFFMLARLSMPLSNTFTRMIEYRADSFAVQVSEKREAYISVMRKLAESNPIIIDPPKVVEWILFDHPAPLNRIKAIERAAGK